MIHLIPPVYLGKVVLASESPLDTFLVASETDLCHFTQISPL